MSLLPITRVVLHKHGVAHVERSGPVTGSSVTLAFPRAAADDVLKSLVVLDRAGGRVLGIEVDTADDRDAVLARGRIHLAEDRSLLDLLRDLRGRRVRVEGTDGSALVATAVGVDLEVENALERALFTVDKCRTKQNKQ